MAQVFVLTVGFVLCGVLGLLSLGLISARARCKSVRNDMEDTWKTVQSGMHSRWGR